MRIASMTIRWSRAAATVARALSSCATALRPRTFKGVLLLLVAAPVVPMLVATTIVLWQQQSQEDERALTSLVQLSRGLADAVDRDIATRVGMLQTIAASPLVDRADWAALRVTARIVLARHPHSWIEVASREGQVALFRPQRERQSADGQNRDPSQVDAAQAARLPRGDGKLVERVFRTGHAAVSNLYLEPRLGTPALAIAIPVRRDGATAYVMQIGYSPDHVRALVRKQGFDEERRAVISDREGRIIASSAAGWPSMPAHPADFNPERDSTGARYQDENGVERTSATVASDVSGWRIETSLPAHAMDGGARRTAVFWAGMALVMLAIAAYSALRARAKLAVPLGELAAAASAVRRRETVLPQHFELDEFRRLHDALLDAAESSRQRESGEEAVRSAEERRAHAERAAMEVRQNEELFRATFDNAAVGIAHLSANGNFLRVNERFCAISGHEKDALEGANLISIIHVDDMHHAVQLAAAVVTGHIASYSIETRFVRQRGEPVWVLLTVSLMRIASRAPQFIAVVQDMTEQKRTESALKSREEQLHEADRRKDEFLAMLGHELRNPLAPIRNGAYVLRMLNSTDDRVREAADMITRQAAQLTRLVDDLLDVARITQGRIVLQKRTMAVKAIVDEAIDCLRSAIQDHRHEVSVECSEALDVDADPARLVQIFTNLIGNAIKYTDDGGRIRVTLEREGNEAVMRVADSGIGIPDALLPRLFEPFTQAEQSIARSKGGLGVGLALVKRLVELHGGTVCVESTGPGTTFAVRLPLAAVPGSAAGAEPQLPAAPDTDTRVLVVDDNRDAANSVARLLKLQDMRVAVAYDSDTALALARDFRPHVALLDIGMPVMSGYALAGRMRALPQLRDVTLVAVTGYGQSDDVEKARAAGFDHHLVKPVDPARLIALLALVRKARAA
jgi:PAS domain S-box-containing protein